MDYKLKPIMIIESNQLDIKKGVVQFIVDGFQDYDGDLLLIDPKLNDGQIGWSLEGGELEASRFSALGAKGWWIHPETKFVEASNLHKILYGVEEGASAT